VAHTNSENLTGKSTDHTDYIQ